MKRLDQTRQRATHILDAAMACFIAQGFHPTSMRDIAQAAGVSLGNLYNHFASKEALILAVAGAEQTELAPLLAALASGSGGRTALKRFLRDYHALCTRREWARLSVEVLAESARNPAVATAFARNRAQVLQALATYIARLPRATALSPALIAQLLLDAVESDGLRRGLDADGAIMPARIPVLQPALLDALLGSAI